MEQGPHTPSLHPSPPGQSAPLAQGRAGDTHVGAGEPSFASSSSSLKEQSNPMVFRSSYLPSAVSPEVLAEYERSEQQQLAALHLLSPSGVPNVGALLLLGRDPRAWLPSAYIQFVRFEGEQMTAPVVDQKELSGRLDEVLRRAEELAMLNVRTASRVEGSLLEQRTPDYPLVALQQLLRNAVTVGSGTFHESTEKGYCAIRNPDHRRCRTIPTHWRS